jgi:hypothetical protein
MRGPECAASGERKRTKGRERSRPFLLLVVIVRESGRSSTPRRLDSIAGEYWMPGLAGMTANGAIPAALGRLGKHQYSTSLAAISWILIDGRRYRKRRPIDFEKADLVATCPSLIP